MMSDTDDEVEAPKVPSASASAKRPQTEAQKENFRKALAARAANVAKRNETKDERIINKKLDTLATKAEKLKAKIPPKVKEVVEDVSESDDEEPEIVIIKQSKKPKKRIVVVEPATDSESEPEEVIQKPKPKLPIISEPSPTVSFLPRVNNLCFY